MKYSDIEKFSKPIYRVTVMWAFLESALDTYREIGLQLNPDFQRGHVWTEEQQIKYVEFIFRGGVSGREIYFNCKGWGGSFEGPVVCVDGLQRLTAASLFMNNKIPIFGGNYLEDFKDFKKVPVEISFTFNVNNIEHKKDVLKWYLWMNEGGTPHSEKEILRIKKLCKLTR